jgi:hypothetical protein
MKCNHEILDKGGRCIRCGQYITMEPGNNYFQKGRFWFRRDYLEEKAFKRLRKKFD